LRESALLSLVCEDQGQDWNKQLVLHQGCLVHEAIIVKLFIVDIVCKDQGRYWKKQLALGWFNGCSKYQGGLVD